MLVNTQCLEFKKDIIIKLHKKVMLIVFGRFVSFFTHSALVSFSSFDIVLSYKNQQQRKYRFKNSKSFL